MQRKSITLSILTAVFLVVCSAISWAQTITGSVSGTVTDPSGAFIANAKVDGDQRRNRRRNARPPPTNEGIYNIRFLQIGNYKVTIKLAGFAASTYGPFALETGQNAKIDGQAGRCRPAAEGLGRSRGRSPAQHREPHPGNHARYPRHREHSSGQPQPDRHDDVSSRLRQHPAQQLRQQRGRLRSSQRQ